MTHSLSRTIERVIIAFELIVIIVCICDRWQGGFDKKKLLIFFLFFLYFGFAFKSTAL